ncbi:MAG TPA: PAS domain-containing protein, partial [Verrucomicrobiae bacterium]|nr:PAS domain-containing protein [Verrucomicrobiae bacterium]
MNASANDKDAGAGNPVGEALQYSPDHLQLVINTIPGFVWSARPDGAIEFLNQRGLEYTGFTLEQLRGRKWEDT